VAGKVIIQGNAKKCRMAITRSNQERSDAGRRNFSLEGAQAAEKRLKESS
jgi:hypothetical protein